MKKILVSLFCLTLLLGACGGKEEEKEPEKEKETVEEPTEKEETLKDLKQFAESYDADQQVVILHTTKGDITIVLFPEEAPKTVENFVTHAKDGYYDGVKFHRIITDFMIQGGDPEGTGMGGESIWGGSFEDEFSDKLYNFNGALSMANGGPNTNGSQFFIVQAKTAEGLDRYPSLQEIVKNKYNEVGGTPWLDGQHTVFGQVISGMDVVDAIAMAEAVDSKPVEDILIQSITVTTYGELNK